MLAGWQGVIWKTSYAVSRRGTYQACLGARRNFITGPPKDGGLLDAFKAGFNLKLGASTLAIETSCDDTSVAILETELDIKSSGLRNQYLKTNVAYHKRVTANNDAYNGIHPLVALHSHQENLAKLVQDALATWNSTGQNGTSKRPDFVSVTRGPGMRSNLTIGLELAKGLSVAWGVPIIGIHHMQAHALTPRLCATMPDLPDLYTGPWNPFTLTPAFPYLSVLASGGHTLLINSAGLTDHQILAQTSDIALGDCLDKAARAIIPPSALKPPYGKALEAFAFPNGANDYNYAAPTSRQEELVRWPTAYAWSLGPPLAESKGGDKTSKRMEFSFAGLLSSVERFMKFETDSEGRVTTALRDPNAIPVDERREMAREVLRVTFEHLISRIILYLKSHTRAVMDADIDTVVVSGGVASNQYLRHVIRAMLDARGFKHIQAKFPPVELCTDNALMIAWAGMEMFHAGYRSTLDVQPLRKWSMDPSAEDGGILGVGGWTKDGEPVNPDSS